MGLWCFWRGSGQLLLAEKELWKVRCPALTASGMRPSPAALPPRLQESSPRAQRILAAVEAAAAALHLMTVPNMPPRGA